MNPLMSSLFSGHHRVFQASHVVTVLSGLLTLLICSAGVAYHALVLLVSRWSVQFKRDISTYTQYERPGQGFVHSCSRFAVSRIIVSNHLSY